MPYVFKLECGHLIKETTRTRYLNYKYKGVNKTTCPDCNKLSVVLSAGSVRAWSYP